MLNREWHQTHRLPRNATLEERIAWHVEHAQVCGCRDMPERIKAKLKERGMAQPRRRTD